MKHATEKTIGHREFAQKGKAKATAQAVGRIRKLHATGKRGKACHRGEKAVGSPLAVTDGFLRCRFLPKFSPPEQGLGGETEGDLSASLSQLYTHFRMEPFQRKVFNFPYDLALAYWDASCKLKAQGKDCSLQLVRDEENRVSFSCSEFYDTGSLLYYIPVNPLYAMLRDRKRKRLAQLFLSVFSYLYHIADVPYYRQGLSYLSWQYEMLSDWIEEDEEENENMNLLRWAEWMGDRIEQKIFNVKNLAVFRDRLKGFLPKDEFESQGLTIAQAAYNLYRQYPNESLFRHASVPVEAMDGEEEVIALHKCVSFIADTEGSLYQALAECINTEFNEYALMEELTVHAIFNGKEMEHPNLDFEKRAFPLLEDICYFLDNYKNN